MEAEFLIPIAFFASMFGVAALFFTTRNRERMALIEKGADPAIFRNPNRGRSSLKFGLVFVGVSLGILMGALLHATVPGMSEETCNFAMIFLFGGLALIVSHLLERKENGAKGKDGNA
jgi:ABC-type Fe3+-siderophore transport system permease subunit